MKTTTHGNHLIQLTRFGAINCYLLREDDGFTLIDTGMAGSAEQILAAARQYGLPIVRIVLTHAHVDHVGSLEVIATPGHTPGHAAFLDNRDRTIIEGDAFQTLGGVAVSGTLELLFPLPALATWHKPLALESARKLLAFAPAQLAVGHGRVLANPVVKMEQAIATLARELDRQKQHVA